jgi:hypothetical protein
MIITQQIYPDSSCLYGQKLGLTVCITLGKKVMLWADSELKVAPEGA